jgi:hypothetical protein
MNNIGISVLLNALKNLFTPNSKPKRWGRRGGYSLKQKGTTQFHSSPFPFARGGNTHQKEDLNLNEWEKDE